MNDIPSSLSSFSLYQTGGSAFEPIEIARFLEENPSILGIGCDIVEITRFQSVIDRLGASFLNRLFTIYERTECDARTYPTPSYAARFAAKEALAKALGCGISKDLGWHDMEIYKTATGKPEVRWSSQALLLHPILKTYISMSHSDSHAIAFAIITQP